MLQLLALQSSILQIRPKCGQQITTMVKTLLHKLARLGFSFYGTVIVNTKEGNYPMALRKHAYSNILKLLPPKNENFQIKNSDIFHISAQNIDCGYLLELPRRGSSNEYP